MYDICWHHIIAEYNENEECVLARIIARLIGIWNWESLRELVGIGSYHCRISIVT